MKETLADLTAMEKTNISLKLGVSRLELIAAALTHPSLGKSRKTTGLEDGINYQRLEFLGDRVLGLVIATHLFEKFADEDEGRLALRFAALVSADALVAVAKRAGLVEHIRLARGIGLDKSSVAASIIADSCEALVGAIYIDGGLAKATDFVMREWADLLDHQVEPPQDPVTTLQIWTQARGLGLPIYKVISQNGPAHDPIFEVAVSVDGTERVLGKGRSKKIATRAAAEGTLMFLREHGRYLE